MVGCWHQGASKVVEEPRWTEGYVSCLVGEAWFPPPNKKKAALEREKERKKEAEKKEMFPITTSAESNAERGEGRLRSKSS
jgi:hypothetical protein